MFYIIFTIVSVVLSHLSYVFLMTRLVKMEEAMWAYTIKVKEERLYLDKSSSLNSVLDEDLGSPNKILKGEIEEDDHTYKTELIDTNSRNKKIYDTDTETLFSKPSDNCKDSNLYEWSDEMVTRQTAPQFKWRGYRTHMPPR